MKKHLPILPLLLSLVPFAVKLPYCFEAMKSSPAERFNWCFLVGAIFLAALALPKIFADGFPKVDFKPLKCVVVVIPLMLVLFGVLRNIYLAVLLGGAALPFSIVYCIYGWREAFLLLPAFGMLLLSIPNVGLLLSSLLGWKDLLIKVTIAILLVAAIPLFYTLKKPVPKLSTAIFCSIAILVALAYLASGHYSAALQLPVAPDFGKLISDNFRGVKQIDVSNYKNFYGDSDIRLFSFSDNDGNMSNILQVSKIQNIHNVHPTTFCIRISGYGIVSEQTIHLSSKGNAPAFDVQEIVAEQNGMRHIFWQWYSTPHKSTASFLLFRTLYSPNGEWTAFLMDASVNGSIESTREMLHSMILAFLK
jgi:hypothetical protein